jgi:MFS transporter, SHS family, lactate transporter
MLGGTVVGWSSQVFGRRFSIIIISIVGAALLYPYTFVTSHAVIAPAFFEQFCVQGAWGVIPIHLVELSPGSFRTFVVGTAYQLGNLVSSASSTIETTIGERFPLPPTKTVALRYKYGLVICIVSNPFLLIPKREVLTSSQFMGCVYLYVILITFMGPEYLGRSMRAVADRDFEDAAGREAIEKGLLGHQNGHHNGLNHENGQKKEVDEINEKSAPTGLEKT